MAAMSGAVVDVRAELGATVVRPGQTLVVCSPGQLTAEQAHALKVHLQEQLPGVAVVLAIGVSQALVYEPLDAGSAGQ